MKPAGLLTHVFIFTGSFVVGVGTIWLLFYLLGSPSYATEKSFGASTDDRFLKSGIITGKGTQGHSVPNFKPTSMTTARRALVLPDIAVLPS
jgi:hypothetical protein